MKRGRKPKWLKRERVERAVVSALPGMPQGKTPRDEGPAPDAKASGRVNLIVKSGLSQQVVWLRFFGYSNHAVAERLKVSDDSIDRYVKTPHFVDLYEKERPAMLAKVDDALRERVQEVMLEALQVKIDLMRSASCNRFLKNKIATELLELGKQAIGGSGRPSDEIWAIYEEAKREGPKGTTITKTTRIEGPPEATLPVAARRSGPDDLEGGGGTSGSDALSGGVGREAGT